MILIRELERLRRTTAQYVEKWNQVGSELYDTEGQYIGRMSNDGLARYVSRLHNLFLPTMNLLLTLKKKLIDRKAMTKEVLNDKRPNE